MDKCKQKPTSGQKPTPREKGGLGKGTRGSYLPETASAEIIGLRKAGFSYRAISQKTGRDTGTIMRVLHSPEAQRVLAESSDKILAAYRERALQLVPEALEGLEELIAARDRGSISKLLFGTQVLTPKMEQVVKTESADSERSPEDKKFFLAHGGHWPEEPCTCSEVLAPVQQMPPASPRKQ